MKIVPLIIIKFFFISALFIISNGNLHLKESEQREIFFNAYLGWLNNIVNQGAELIGYVINSRWLPENEIALNKS